MYYIYTFHLTYIRVWKYVSLAMTKYIIHLKVSIQNITVWSILKYNEIYFISI